jgi:hypothetical protein
MAMLERHNKDGGPPPANIPVRQVMNCPNAGCDVAYTLFYSDSENTMIGSVKNVDRMLMLAAEIISDNHPPHFTKTYLWKAIGEPECRWVEADSQAARAAL